MEKRRKIKVIIIQFYTKIGRLAYHEVIGGVLYTHDLTRRLIDESRILSRWMGQKRK